MGTILETYQEDFKELIDTMVYAYHGLPLHISKPHLEVLYSLLSKERHGPVLEREEFVQQLSTMWLSYARVYQRTKPNIHIRQYLIRRSIWGLRDWFNKEVKDHFLLPYHLVSPEEKPLYQFRLDLRFLLYGTKFVPLSILSPYERYIIFLKFKEDRTILEIAEAVQKTEKTVGLQFNRIIDKLRSESKCQQEHKKI